LRFWSINNQINAISGSGSSNMKYRGTMVIHGPYFVHIFCVQFLAGYSRTFSVWRQGMSSNMISERNQPRSLRCWRGALQRGQTEHDRTLQDRQNMTEPFNLRSYRIPVPQPHWIPRTCPNRTPQNGYYRVYRVLYHLVPRSNIKSARGPRHSWCSAFCRRFAMCWASPSPESQRSKALCWQRWSSCASAPGGGTIRRGSLMPNRRMRKLQLKPW
jgi:hypothetical protein